MLLLAGWLGPWAVLSRAEWHREGSPHPVLQTAEPSDVWPAEKSPASWPARFSSDAGSLERRPREDTSRGGLCPTEQRGWASVPAEPSWGLHCDALSLEQSSSLRAQGSAHLILVWLSFSLCCVPKPTLPSGPKRHLGKSTVYPSPLHFGRGLTEQPGQTGAELFGEDMDHLPPRSEGR